VGFLLVLRFPPLALRHVRLIAEFKLVIVLSVSPYVFFGVFLRIDVANYESEICFICSKKGLLSKSSLKRCFSYFKTKENTSIEG